MTPFAPTFATIAGVGLLWIAASGAFLRAAYACIANAPIRININQAFLLAGCFLASALCCLAISSMSREASAAAAWGMNAIALAALAILTKAWRSQAQRRTQDAMRLEHLSEEYAQLQSKASSIEAQCAAAARTFGLTRKEEEILLLVASGQTYPQICERLVLSPNTVKTHARNIYRKLGASSKQEALAALEALL